MNENTLTKEWLADNEVVTEEHISLLQNDRESAINYLLEKIESNDVFSIGNKIEINRLSSYLASSIAYTLATTRKELIDAQESISELEGEVERICGYLSC